MIHFDAGLILNDYLLLDVEALQRATCLLSRILRDGCLQHAPVTNTITRVNVQTHTKCRLELNITYAIEAHSIDKTHQYCVATADTTCHGRIARLGLAAYSARAHVRSSWQ